MPYQQLTSIADDVIAKLEATGVFGSVTWVALDNHRQLMEHAKTIAVTPKAVVCIGSGNYHQQAMYRVFTIAIVVFSKFKRSRQRTADAVWTLADAASGPFIPIVETDAPPVFPVINGVKYELKGWEPLETDDRTASFVVELQATEIIKYPIV